MEHGQIRTSDHAVIRVHLGGLSLCWKGSAAELEPRTVPGHSVWMKVIASGGWPAAETQCPYVGMCVKFRATALCPYTPFIVYLLYMFVFFYHYILKNIYFLICFSRHAVLVNM